MMNSPEKPGFSVPFERSSSKNKMAKMLGTSMEEVDRATQLAVSKSKKMAKSSDNLLAVMDEKKADLKNQLMRKVKWPADYTFSQEDSPSVIVFEEDNEHQIRAGTLNKLVERLTFDEQIDPNYLFEFLLTYRSFTTPRDLLKLLIDRWCMPIPEEIQLDEIDYENFKQIIQKPIRLRVFNVLKKWLDEHWYDWEADSALQDELRSFIETTMSKSGLDTASSTISKLLTKKIEGIQSDVTLVYTKPPPDSFIPDVKAMSSHSGTSSHLAFLAFHPEEIARQITLIEWDLFKSIKPWECTGQSWAKKEKETKAPNILGMILRFNKVSMWVKNTLVKTESLKLRQEALIKFIEVAEKLRAMNNFNGIMEILAGLRSAAVHRLRKTWDGISNKHERAFNDLSELMSPYSNYTKFRNYLHKEIAPPCIPYLGVYLTDLTFIEDGNPDTLQELINFDKRRRIASVIKEIKQYQQTPYNFNVVPMIKGFLLAGGEYVDENECYKLSLLREPKDEPKDASAKAAEKPAEKTEKTPGTPEKKKTSIVKFMRQSISLKKKNTRSNSDATSPSPTSPTASPIAASAINSNPTNRIHRTVSIDSLVEAAIEGGSYAIESYLEGLTNKTDKEKEALREEIQKLVEQRQRNLDDEVEEIPFETLIGFLEEGNNAAFEKYLENFDYYDAELIRAQTIEQYTKKKAFAMF